MHVLFVISAIFAIAGIVAAMTLRDPIHCILSLTVGLVSFAGLYISLGAQFVGFTQILVYVGAVAILAIFALMMTRSRVIQGEARKHFSALPGVIVAAAVFGVFADAVLHTRLIATPHGQAPVATVDQIGIALLHEFSVPLEVVGILLTAALIGAVIVALPDSTETL